MLDGRARRYPFGFDGNPVQPSSAGVPGVGAGATGRDDPIVCYLSVDSMAFRAWNRGIAVTSPPPNSEAVHDPLRRLAVQRHQVVPRPDVPGAVGMQGTDRSVGGQARLLGGWPDRAGRRRSWPALCRFDGVNFEWEPLAVPKAALAHVPVDPTTGNPVSGAIQAGACFAWNDCWFFGSFGVVLRWDGQSLTDATPDTANANSPWLESDFTAAIARTDAGGNPFAFAVGDPFSVTSPDGTSPAQVWRSSGRAFTPVGGSSSPVATGRCGFQLAGPGLGGRRPRGPAAGELQLVAALPPAPRR